MGKRTRKVTGKTHKPRPRDFWSTIDPKAVRPLLPHLPPRARAAEPMAGNGSLMRLLAPHVAFAWAADLKPMGEGIAKGDALKAKIGDADFWLTNPPWTRAILHDVIVHLSDQAPTFLLFDSDWQNTNQAGRFMERCRKIIHVGRLIWIPGTTNAGFTSCSWYEFGRPIPGSGPRFFGHGCAPVEAPARARRICADCGIVIDRAGKWRLEARNGVPAPVHRDCADPAGRLSATPAETPLLDWRVA